jgi:phosphoribosylformimino-5-aminoimidazole carboxamide ribotide isomerase
MQQEFQILPAIDIKNGRVVRSHGITDPVQLAKQFEEQGAQHLHVVDLNGALDGTATNLPIIQQILELSSCKIEISAGIETIKSLEKILDLNPWQVILSSKLLFDIPRLTKLIRGKPVEKITLSIDHNNGMLASRGWKETSDIPLGTIIPDLTKSGIKRYIVTDVTKDASLQGADIYEALHLKKTINARVIVSGGIKSDVEVQSIQSNGLDGVILGTALLQNKITMAQLRAICNKLTS